MFELLLVLGETFVFGVFKCFETPFWLLKEVDGDIFVFISDLGAVCVKFFFSDFVLALFDGVVFKLL